MKRSILIVSTSALLSFSASMLVMSACTGPQRFIATAESFSLLADEYASTAQLMEGARAAHTITEAQYQRWSAFSRQFKASFNLAVDLYEAALKVDDKLTADKAAEIVGRLAVSLAEFYDAVVKATPVTCTSGPCVSDVLDGGVL